MHAERPVRLWRRGGRLRLYPNAGLVAAEDGAAAQRLMNRPAAVALAATRGRCAELHATATLPVARMRDMDHPSLSLPPSVAR